MTVGTNGYSAYAFIAGALIGTGATLLLAPQSGEELRGMLKQQARKAERTALKKASALRTVSRRHSHKITGSFKKRRHA